MSTSTIDPRIRARRIAVQRDEGRKRLRRLAIVCGVALVIAAAWGLTRTPLLDLDHVRIVGADHSGAEAVASASGLAPGTPMLDLALGDAADAVAALPWVQSVDVHRSWPGTVRIEVVERTAAAAVPAAADGWILVDAEGRQLAHAAEPPAGLLRIEVPPVPSDPGGQVGAASGPALRLAATLPDALRDRVLALRPAAGNTVEGTVRLRDGAEAALLLGDPDQMPAKWLAVLSVLEGADPARLTIIDVRVPSVPALTRR